MGAAVFQGDFDRATHILAGAYACNHQQVAHAIAEERERCAKIAEGHNAAGKAIAKKIRRGSYGPTGDG